MDQSPSQGKKWALTQQAFDQLLARLDPDRDRAAQEYELIRRKLMEFFDGWGCAFSEDYADETMNRVARIINEGKEISNLNSYYFLGVARNVLKEYWRKQKKESAGLDLSPPFQAGGMGESEQSQAMERCMEQCLQRLPPADREFIIAYYEGEKRQKIEAKKKLAERLGLTSLQMRKRAFRIRSELKACANECLNHLRTGGNRFDVFASII